MKLFRLINVFNCCKIPEDSFNQDEKTYWGADHTSNIPPEIFKHIFSFLTLEERATCCLTSKSWRQENKKFLDLYQDQLKELKCYLFYHLFNNNPDYDINNFTEKFHESCDQDFLIKELAKEKINARVIKETEKIEKDVQIAELTNAMISNYQQMRPINQDFFQEKLNEIVKLINNKSTGFSEPGTLTKKQKLERLEKIKKTKNTQARIANYFCSNFKLSILPKDNKAIDNIINGINVNNNLEDSGFGAL